MDNLSPKGKFKFLLPLLFLSFIIVQAYCAFPDAVNINNKQVVDTSKNKSKDIPKVQIRDTSKPPIADSGKSTVKGAGSVPVKDSSKFQGNDTSKLKGKDSLSIAKTNNQQIPDSVVYKQLTFTEEEIIRGERLFSGLVYLGNASVNCSGCHNIRVVDTLNWNPDAIEISQKYLHKNASGLSRILLKPAGAKMKLVHKGFQLSAKDIVEIKAYMDTLVIKGLQKNKPVITNLLLVIAAFILLFIAVTDLIIKKIFNKRINWAIITVTGVYITYILVVYAIGFGRATGFSPAQPIKFSHAVHAGQNQTDCNYCHYTAKISKTAGIPPGSVCLNCHYVVRNGTRSGQTEIAKIIAHLDEKKSVDWVRLYKLPDFVFFSHEQHVSAGQINCVACHGDVKQVNRLYQFADLSMGWCIDCHKTRKVNLSNKYYKAYYSGFYDSLKAGQIDSVRVIGIGGRDCGKCHY